MKKHNHMHNNNSSNIFIAYVVKNSSSNKIISHNYKQRRTRVVIGTWAAKTLG